MSFIENTDISGTLNIIDFASKSAEQIINKKYYFSEASANDYEFKMNLSEGMKGTHFTLEFLFKKDAKVTIFKISGNEYFFHKKDDTNTSIAYLKQTIDIIVDTNLNTNILSTIKIYNS